MVNKHARSVLRIALKPEPTQRGTSRGNGASRSGPNKARAAFSPCGAARINVAALLLITVPTPDGRGALAHGRANVITLSCKPPHTPALLSGAAAAATNTKWQERTA